MFADELDRKGHRFADGSQWKLAAVVLTCGVGGLLYRWIWWGGLGTSSLMFVGLPIVLAVLFSLIPKAKSAKGATLKGITIVLLVIAPLVGEGYLCILFAAPLFYGFGLLLAAGIDLQNKRNGVKAWAWLALIPMALEGLTPTLSFGRTEHVEDVRVLNAAPDQIEARLSDGLRVQTPLPAFMNIGFPRPMANEGTGLRVNDMRRIHFSGAEGDGPGDLVMRVALSEPGHVRFERVSDGTHLRQWIAWEVSEVRWHEVAPGKTQVRWEIQYARRIDPAWYFGPWERFAVKQAAGYLIAANAGPR